ncbi:hypothetical protein [Mycobacterium sp. URHB0044]|jgi:hypothetical protein|uniref:hypothetical protein n=1 Tax=Mycobacterium sp. URHB0044 TaxID=1380386 RepID=UPI0004902672|nr:hypothetical protein [Mycobacterium sp. URHB0044]
MDRFDREILDFMRSWAPYGGPPADEVLEEFGMTRDELVDRMHLIVATEAAQRERELRRPWLRVQANEPSTGIKRRKNSRTKGL